MKFIACRFDYGVRINSAAYPDREAATDAFFDENPGVAFCFTVAAVEKAGLWVPSNAGVKLHERGK